MVIFSFVLIVVVILLMIAIVALLMRRKPKVNCYFDTSIYNQILDDPDKDLIIKKLRKNHIIAIPSLVNLCEILQTSDENRKQKLLNIYHMIRDDYHALKPFTTLLKDTVNTIQKGSIYVEVNMPVVINRETELLCKDALKDKGSAFDGYSLNARAWLEKEGITDFPDARTFFENSHDERRNQSWIDLFVGACKGLGIADAGLDEETILRIVKDPNSPWKYYLDTYLLIFHRRAMRTTGHGRKSNPGGADLEQGIYLSWADIYVIQDGLFYDFIKELKEILDYSKGILNYDEFKEYLGLKISKGE